MIRTGLNSTLSANATHKRQIKTHSNFNDNVDGKQPLRSNLKGNAIADSTSSTAQVTEENCDEISKEPEPETASAPGPNLIQLDDFVGEHGPYQLSITALLFVRYVLLGLMANSGPLMTPDVTFYCELPRQEIFLIMPNISRLTVHEQDIEIKEEFKQICQIDLHLYQNLSQLNNATTRSQLNTVPLIVAAGQQRQKQHSAQDSSTNGATNLTSSGQSSAVGGQPIRSTARIRECTDFTYELAQDQGLTMTSEFDLVCDRDWLRSLFQSLISASIVVAHVIWGTFSDKYGRFQAQRICLVVSLGAGTLSIFAPDFWTFTLTRAVCSFGDLGMVVSLTTVVVELVGSRYRGLSVALVNFGYALGVSLLPYVVAYFENFRQVVGFTVLCHMITMPFVLATNESIRWLLTNRKFDQARKELRRIVRWNRACRDFWHPTKWQCAKSTPATHRQQAGDKKWPHHGQQRGETFNLKFNEFVDQIESQNLYDPVVEVEAAKKQNRMKMKTNKKKTTTDEFKLDVPTILISEQAPSVAGGGVEQGANCEQQVPFNGQPAASIAPDSLIVTCEPIKRSYSNSAQFDAASESWRGSGKRMKRSQSCNQLFANYSSAINGNETSNKRPRVDQRQVEAIDLIGPEVGGEQRLLDARLRTLTLPQLSRDSSIYSGSDDDDDDNDNNNNTIARRHLRRQSGCQQQPECINLVAHQLSFVGRVSRLFKDKQLMIAVFTIVWTTFNSELLYTSFIIINLEVGEDVYLNYVLGGCMEALAAIMASLLLSYSPRRVSLIAFWLLISLSCFGLSLAHIDSTWAVWMLALAKFSQSSLSSIASVAAYESFPTFLRQSGSGLVFTLGMLGSVFAPLIFAEFDDHAGMDRVLMTFSCSSLTAAILIYLYLNETRNCELM